MIARVLAWGFVAAAVVGVFYWEWDFATHSETVQGQVISSRVPSGRRALVVTFRYRDPETGDLRQGKVVSPPTMLQGYERGQIIRVRRDTRDHSEFKFDRWHTLYAMTMGVLFIVVMGGGAMIWYRLSPRTPD